MAESDLKDWELRQSRTFSKWVNMYLSKKGHADRAEPEGTAFAQSFTSSVLILKLLDSLYDVPLPKKYHKNPKSRVLQLDNANAAMKAIDKAEIKMTGLNKNNILDGSFKMMMGMVWNIILDYNIKGISVEDQNAKQGLLIWCQKKTKDYQGVNGNIKNFSKDWKNGNAFLALVDKHTTGLVDYDASFDKSAEEKLDEAFTACEQLSIPRLIEVSDLTEVEHPDDKAVMTYVSELFKLFSKEDVKDTARQHVSQFLKFQRRVNVLTKDYEEKAEALTNWINQKCTDWNEAGEPDTDVKCSEMSQAFKAYLMEEKPAQIASMIDALDLYSNIQGELKVNGRVPYVPPEGLEPDNLQEAVTALSEEENKHINMIRNVRSGLVEKIEVGVISDEMRAEWEKAYTIFDRDNSGHLSKDEYRAALSAVGISLSDEDFEQTFATQAVEAHISKEQFLTYLESFYSTEDTADSITKSCQLLGNPHAGDFDMDQLGLDEEDMDYLNGEMGEDGTLADYIAAVFA